MTKRPTAICAAHSTRTSDALAFTLDDLEAATWSHIISEREAQQLITLRHRARLMPGKRARVPRRLAESVARLSLFQAKPANRKVH